VLGTVLPSLATSRGINQHSPVNCAAKLAFIPRLNMATQWCPGVEVRIRPSGDRAVVATTSLPKGAPICTIAAADAMDARAAVSDAAVAAALAALGDACGGVVPSVELAIVLKLAHEAFHESTGVWTDYVHSLPPTAPGLMHAAEAVVGPLLDALAGTPLACVRSKRASLEESLAAVCRIVGQPWCTQDRVRWAHGMFTSRAMMIPSMPPGSWRTVDVPAMVPLADMCNHSSRVAGSSFRSFRYERATAAAAAAAAPAAIATSSTAPAADAPAACACSSAARASTSSSSPSSPSSPLGAVQLADLEGREAGYVRMLDFLHAKSPAAARPGGDGASGGAAAAAGGGGGGAAGGAARAGVAAGRAPPPPPTPGVVTLCSTAAVPIDSEVFINYGPKSNEELLLWYGFALASNKADTVDIELLSAAPVTTVTGSTGSGGAAFSGAAELDTLFRADFPHADAGESSVACRLAGVQPADDAVFACMRALLTCHGCSTAVDDASTLAAFDPLASEAEALARRLRVAFLPPVPDATMASCLAWFSDQLLGLAARVEEAAGRCTEVATAASPPPAGAAAMATSPSERARLATAARTCLMGYGGVLRAQAAFVGEVAEALAAGGGASA